MILLDYCRALNRVLYYFSILGVCFGDESHVLVFIRPSEFLSQIQVLAQIDSSLAEFEQ